MEMNDALPRYAEAVIATAMADTRVVGLVGPRQSGKTTLARKIAGSDRPYLTLDDEGTRLYARNDPTGFVRRLDRAVIDEIQRAPALILAIKRSVDEDPRPGRFLVTGSADLFAGTLAPDSLAGRIETIPLLPLSQGEIERRPPPTFLDRAFSGSLSDDGGGRTDDLVERVLAGGFPEALARTDPSRRRTWLMNYVKSLTERDVLDIGGVGKPDMMRLLVDHAALLSGGLLNMSALGARVGADSKTIDRWLGLLETLFLVTRVRPWFRNEAKRLIKTPKLHFVDSALLAALTAVNAAVIGRDRSAFGPLLEGFVYAELVKAIGLSPTFTTLTHYRDKDQAEVDFVLERTPGSIVGIEVKASATVRPDDFKGLIRLRGATGAEFALGVLLHDGDAVIPYGDRLLAAPVSALWR
jgi:predicted AAA+ superfamily ATPase